MKKIHLLFSCIISGIFLAGSVTSASTSGTGKPTQTGKTTQTTSQSTPDIEKLIPNWIKSNPKYYKLIKDFDKNMMNYSKNKESKKNADNLLNKICGPGGLFRSQINRKYCSDHQTLVLAYTICLKNHTGSFFGGRAFKDSDCAKTPYAQKVFSDMDKEYNSTFPSTSLKTQQQKK